jgi:hypothetical protein
MIKKPMHQQLQDLKNHYQNPYVKPVGNLPKREEPIEIQWIKHVKAEENGPKEDIIENVSLSAAHGIRGDSTDREYTMPEALAMTKKYDRLAAAGYFRKDPHINKLSATDAVIASATGGGAARYHKQDPKLLKNYYELRAKRNKILSDIKKEKLRGDALKKAWGLTKKNTKVKAVEPTIEVSDIGTIKNLDKPKIKKVASAANKPEEANGYDFYPNVIPIGPIPHEKPFWEDTPDDDAAYKFKFPKEGKYTVLDKIKLHADLTKAADANSGIGRYDKRKRLASGGNGGTSKWDEEHSFQKRIEDIYGIQLTGQESFGELLEIIRKLNEQE